MSRVAWRAAAALLCTTMLWFLPRSMAQEPFWARWAGSDPEGLVGRTCTSTGGPPTLETSQARNLLERRLEALLNPDTAAGDRRRLALYHAAVVLPAKAGDKLATIDRARDDIGSGRLDKTVSALYDLEQLVLFTARLRNQRAEMTRIRFGARGEVLLTVRPPRDAIPLEKVVARAVADLLEDAIRARLDCTGGKLYTDALAKAGDRTTVPITSIRQEDLRRLYETLESFHDACVAGIAAGNTFLSDIDGAPPSGLMDALASVQTFLVKARDVLTLAIEQYGDALDERLDGGLPDRHIPPGIDREAKSTPPPPRSDPSLVPSPTPEAVAPATAEKSPGELERDAFIADIYRQVNMLRAQQGGEFGGLATRPASSANNLHIRMKRLYRIANLATTAGERDGTFQCTLAGERVSVVFERHGGRLRRIRAVVTEYFSEGVTLEWYVALDRRSDTDFTLESSIGGIGAHMDVVKGEPVNFPNYQQIIILMNRLDQIVEGGRTARGPIDGPAE